MSEQQPSSGVTSPDGPASRARAFRPVAPPAVALADLSAVLGASVSRGTGVLVSGISNDSRAILPGDLYAALPGAHRHGAEFAAQARTAGAVAVLTDPEGARLLADDDLPVLVHREPRAVLGDLAARIYGNGPDDGLRRFGVTGTNGKTTTSYFINALLRALGTVPGLIGTIEILAGDEAIPSVLTTPESSDVQALMARMREHGLGAVTMEVSSHALEFHRVDGVVFDVVGFTNLTQDHLDLHGGMEEYFTVKAQLFTPGRARRGVVIVDGGWGGRFAQASGIPVTRLALPGEPAEAEWRVQDVASHGALGSDFVLAGPAGERISAHVPLPGEFNIANAALAMVMVLESGVSPEGLEALFAEGEPLSVQVPGRMQLLATEPRAIVDFAHNPDALERALEAVRGPEGEGRVIVVFGATGERDAGKRPIMGATAVAGADVVIVTDDDPHDEDAAAIRAAVLRGAEEARDSAHPDRLVEEVFPRDAAIRRAVELAGPRDTILVAGRGHEVWQEVKGVNIALDDREELRTALTARGFRVSTSND
ncbi:MULTISPECIES: UDP-N-acetylmuramoyl-L-alanyl-D-glutamate--2,6-diaminopimelate ligase [Arthrobacter]|uniref:UDP-N-acetylmuramyl-tripeptide synthetase n=2 Tax=Arthrobacter TaxID=1663 RepID=A0ABU9KHA9_9MICC|nr:UDP-N-acetylmuramoyl-L-alanyl-D-glutamate--2,6-diaminopimelate ligase [Arthrobacter sp. YJM1]MDP5226207.1 UDP-N-acetylmuramoyl-L-alanyl-D-glutamate--2,6-diaminopimelate ligase [Arthrobacter sp. YJM1]